MLTRYRSIFCEKAVPKDPKIESLGNGEKNFFIDIGYVTREEKYEWDMAKVCVRNFSIGGGSE